MTRLFYIYQILYRVIVYKITTVQYKISVDIVVSCTRFSRVSVKYFNEWQESTC